MKIPSSKIDEILEASDIYEIINDVVPLKKLGNSFKGLCPFHSEKTPSFNVHPDKGFYHCFGCGTGGNIISFVMNYYSLPFPEAVRFLADRYGVEMEYEGAEVSQTAKDIAALHEELVLDSRRNLYSGIGKEALTYLKSRNFSDSLLEKFMVGWFPQKFDTEKYVRKYDKSVLINSGLFKEGQFGMRLMFFDRVMIPVRGVSGRTIAFSGRTISGQMPKYINSPETEIFKKRKVLFNLDHAKEHIRKKGHVLIVEGYFDVMRLHDKGFGNSVATMGTALTSDHVALLKRFTEDIYMLYDGDDAGYNSALKSLDVFVAADSFPSVIFLPKDDDPDTFLDREGAEGFEKLLETRKDLFVFTAETLAEAAGDMNSSLRALERMKQLLVKVKSPYRKEHYADKLAEIFNVGKEILKKDIDLSAANNSLKIVSKRPVRNTDRGTTYIYEREFIATLFKLPEDVALMQTENILPEFFNDKKLAEIYKKVLDVLRDGDNISVLLCSPDVGSELSEAVIKMPETDIYRLAAAAREKLISNSVMDTLSKAIQQSDGGADARELAIIRFEQARRMMHKRNSED
ncbi:DNA primase [Seleniivibrio woodruffii]|uniref:DNA primase n=1 Tax=Seleniivibrio woodruffii TaxID=1078050 RepID=UPI0039E57DDE